MTDIKDKEFSRLKEDLVYMGEGAEKHKSDSKFPLPSNITRQRYVDQEKLLTDIFMKAKDLEKQANEAFDEYHKIFKESNNLKNNDTRTIKGIFGIYNEELRDFGIAPEKQRKGRVPKKN